MTREVNEHRGDRCRRKAREVFRRRGGEGKEGWRTWKGIEKRRGMAKEQACPCLLTVNDRGLPFNSRRMMIELQYGRGRETKRGIHGNLHKL